LLKTGLRDLDPETLKRFGQGGQPFRGHGLVTERRFHGPGVDAVTDFEQHSFANQSTKNAAHLVVAAEVLKLAQKYVTAFVVDAFHDVFAAF
jgi:hypothetical protein